MKPERCLPEFFYAYLQETENGIYSQLSVNLVVEAAFFYEGQFHITRVVKTKSIYGTANYLNR